MDTGAGRAALLTRCLQLNALALAFSLAHTVADYGVIFFAVTAPNEWGMAAYLGVASGVYGWWGWSMAQVAGDGRTGLTSLLVLCGFWAVAHGASFVFTPLTEYVAHVIHFDSLIFGIWGAYATWRVARTNRMAPFRPTDARV